MGMDIMDMDADAVGTTDRTASFRKAHDTSPLG
jgi:hypothetical protein